MQTINAVYAFIECSKRMTSNEPIKNALSAVSCTSVRHFQERNIFTLCFTDILHHPTFASSIYSNINIMNDKCITCSLVLAGSSNFPQGSQHQLLQDSFSSNTFSIFLQYLKHLQQMQIYHNSTTHNSGSVICQEASWLNAIFFGLSVIGNLQGRGVAEAKFSVRKTSAIPDPMELITVDQSFPRKCRICSMHFLCGFFFPPPATTLGESKV